MIVSKGPRTYEYRLWDREMSGYTPETYPNDQVTPALTLVTVTVDSWDELMEQIEIGLDDALYQEDIGRVWSYSRMLLDHIRRR